TFAVARRQGPRRGDVKVRTPALGARKCPRRAGLPHCPPVPIPGHSRCDSSIITGPIPSTSDRRLPAALLQSCSEGSGAARDGVRCTYMAREVARRVSAPLGSPTQRAAPARRRKTFALAIWAHRCSTIVLGTSCDATGAFKTELAASVDIPFFSAPRNFHFLCGLAREEWGRAQD